MLSDARANYQQCVKDYLAALQSGQASSSELWAQQCQLLVKSIVDYEGGVLRLLSPLHRQLPRLRQQLADLQASNQRELHSVKEMVFPADHRDTRPHVREGYLFRKRQKGIGLPWKRVYAVLDSQGIFLDNWKDL